MPPIEMVKLKIHAWEPDDITMVNVEVAPRQNEVVILAVTVAVGMMPHEGRTTV